MKRKSVKQRTIGALLACCLIVAPGMLITATVLPGCDAGAGFLGLQDYQRDLLFGIGSLAIALLGGGNQDGGAGQDITPGCTIEDNDDGTSTITCIQVNADGSTTSTSVTVRSGSASACTVTDVPAGAQITCDDGTNVVVNDGENGTDGSSCSVTDNPDGSATITCTDGTSATIPPGEDGQDGEDGTDGRNGRDGESCDVSETATQVCITCGNDQVCINKNSGLPLFGTLFIDAFYTAAGGSITAARQADNFNPVDIFEPTLNCDVETVAYKMGVPQRYNLGGDGNPITMRVYLYRTGPTDGDCMVLRLDSFRAQRNQRIATYGGTRYLNLDLSGLTPQDGNLEGLLVVDLPLNNGGDLTKSLGFPTPNPADLLAFELNVLNTDRFNDTGCYTILGVDFFESLAGDAAVGLSGVKEVTENADDIVMCGQCAYTNYFDGPDSNDVEGFTTFEADPDDVAIVGGALQLRDDGAPTEADPQVEAQAIAYGIDISGFTNLNLTFNWTALAYTSEYDRFYIQYRPCSVDPVPDVYLNDGQFLGGWTTLFSSPLQNGPQFPLTGTVSIPVPELNGVGCMDLRLLTIVSQPAEGVLVDFIEFCGTPVEPEPRYACVEYACVEAAEGEYATMEDCSSNCLPPMRYTCAKDTCIEAIDGEYETMEDCSSNCVAPVRYTCAVPAGVGIGGSCIESESGEFDSLEECEAECSPGTEPMYSCEFDTNGGFCVFDPNGTLSEADCLQGACTEVIDREAALLHDGV